jgi:HJR/Mrr/RecB family endonuclease
MAEAGPDRGRTVQGTGETAPADGGARRLTADFSGLLGTGRVRPERFFREGLVVLDASVLLDLYRITPQARRQVLDALSSTGARLWVPHQAAAEFSRNRRRVVEQRMSSFTEVRQALRASAADAIDVLESAVKLLQRQRERNATTRRWEPPEVGLDRTSLLARLGGVMDPALAELEALAAEHDVHPGDMQGGDPLLSQIDELLAGRIGPAYPRDRLRALVEEAHSFRYPNQIPPGYLDADKKTPLLAAGDFLLWCQTIDRVQEMPIPDRLVSLITSDTKGDWWELDSRRHPRGPRPELVQELRDAATADLLLLTLKDFLAGAAQHLASNVSGQTLLEVQDAASSIAEPVPDALSDTSAEIDLLGLAPFEFENVVRALFARMGNAILMPPDSADPGYDFMMSGSSIGGRDSIVVNAKRYRSPVNASAVRELYGTVVFTGAQAGVLVTTSSFTHAAREAARRAGVVTLIDGQALLQQLARFGYKARLGSGTDGEQPA